VALHHPLEPLPQSALGLIVVRFTRKDYQAVTGMLGYSFKDKALLRHALTHPSMAKGQTDYQRLEFLGDRVLALVIAEELYRQNPSHREGQMANMHSNLVRGGVCGEIGRQLGVSDFIAVGQSEMRKGVNLNNTVIGDVVEALIGAIYLDSGLEAAKSFVLRNWATRLVERAAVSKDPKTSLQEWALARGLPIPGYKVVKREGLEHSPVFTVELQIKDMDPSVGSGPSKRLAEMAAAQGFLKREGIGL
jgi:ribonuclease-3